MRGYGYSSVRGSRSGRSLLAALVLGAFLAAAAPVRAGFASDDVFLPAVGRTPGALGSQFYTTVWITNLSGAPVTFTFQFLKQGQSNTSPASFSDSIAAGQTKMYENVVETKLGLADAIGAARITATGPVLVSERIYNQPPGADVGDTEGLFFAGVPQSFSIASGESASIQGIDQNGGENFRYNFALIETGGGTPTVNVQVLDDSGVLLGQKPYTLSPYEQLQPPVTDVVAGIATINARITATMTGGTGSVLLAGAQIANESQDSSGFEMSFKESLLGGGGGGLAAVAHDGTLTGDGTAANLLGVAVPLTLSDGTATVSVALGPQGVFAETTDTTTAGVAVWGRGRVFGTYGDVVNDAGAQSWGELGRFFNSSYYGVVGVSFDPTGAAVLAQYVGDGAGTAVQVDNGALKVSGANPTAFSFVASDLDSRCTNNYCGIISNPLTDGDSTAMLIVTHDFTQDTKYLPSPFSTWYDDAIGKWTIYFDDKTSSILGYAFNVLVIKH